MKDYAKFSKKSGPGPFYKGILVICILVSLTGLVYLGKELINNPELNDKLKNLIHGESTKVATKASSKPEAKPTTSIKKPEESIPPKPKFDFYTLLPKMKMSSTVEESPAVQKAPTKTGTEYFILRIASLQNPNAADELIGRLNLLGVDTQTQLIQKNGRTWIRIMSKPFNSFQAAESAQERLHQHHIESLLVKTKI